MASMAAENITAENKQGKEYEKIGEPGSASSRSENNACQWAADGRRDTEKEVKGRGIDLTSRLQLRDDCAAVENIIEKIRKGKFKQKDINGLEPANNPSATSSEAILKR